MAGQESGKVIAVNRKARHDYFVIEALEAGLAKYISETFEVDLDLAQRCGFVEADFFCYGIYLDDFTPEFATLLSLCDSMSVRPIRDRKDYVTISLTCHSHDHLLSDRKMTF